MLRDRRAYDQILASYLHFILPLIEYSLDAEGIMTVQNRTDHLYRYWDATDFAEYLYRCVEETIKRDLHEEIRFLQLFDRAVRETMEIVEMPDRRASLMVRLIIQNEGTLLKNKRDQFGELRDQEIAAIESAVQTAMADARINGPKRVQTCKIFLSHRLLVPEGSVSAAPPKVCEDDHTRDGRVRTPQ